MSSSSLGEMMMFPKSSCSSYFRLILFILVLSSSSAFAGKNNVNIFNITKLLEPYPKLSSFNAYLSTTHLADSINYKNGNITLLALDNIVMSHLLDSMIDNPNDNEEEEAEAALLIKRVLSMHVVLGFYDVNRLQRLSNNTALLTLGNGNTIQDTTTTTTTTMVVTKLSNTNNNNEYNNSVTFSFAIGGPSGSKSSGSGGGVITFTAKLVRAIASVPRYISILQIRHLNQKVPPVSSTSNPIHFHGIESCPTLCLSARSRSKKSEAHPIDTVFKLPSPLPAWPVGEGFASGSIDLGGLVVQQMSTFTKVWEIFEKGPDNLGATFFEPSVLPQGYFMLASYAQPNNRPLYGWVLIGKDTTNDRTNGSLKTPTDYILIWNSTSSNFNANGVGYIWQPIPPDGYKTVGHVVTTSPQKPSLDKIRCVRSDLTEQCEADTWIWGTDQGISPIGIFNSRPSSRGTAALGVGLGSFIIQNGTLACLKNAKNNLSSMPSRSQIDAIIQAYAPRVYFHPDEAFLPSSVSWFFMNGALLYKKGEESKPVAIEQTGSNLPQGGSNDGAYWLDLPVDDASEERVKKGYLQSSQVYIHVKPIFGATFTDTAIWLFYPFNGAAKAKAKFFNLSLGKLGEHVGDWEHVTLRISNFNGQLQNVYLAQHSAGIWVSASELEYQDGNRFVAYSSLHGHAAYHKPESFLQGKDGVGVINYFAKSNMFMDTGANFSVIAAEHLGSAITAPPWLNYCREWGPRIDYDYAKEMQKASKILPGNLKKTFQNAINSLPDEVLKEEGPTGPKMKSSWSGDEV